MGIRINTNTWRSPLQLIDSWLPDPAHNATAHRGFPQLLHRFTRAGWLGRNRGTSTISTVETGPPTCGAASSRACRVRVVPVVVVGSGLRNDARMVISGRMADVCAELDRLAALEHQSVGTARI